MDQQQNPIDKHVGYFWHVLSTSKVLNRIFQFILFIALLGSIIGFIVITTKAQEIGGLSGDMVIGMAATIIATYLFYRLLKLSLKRYKKL